MRVLIALAFLFVVPERAVTQDETTDTGKIARLVEQLGAPEFVAREEATQELWRLGLAAESALREAMESNDKEVVARVSLILDRFRYGIFADSPQDVVLLVEQYRTGDKTTRQRIVEQLISKREIGVIERLIELAADDIARQDVSNWVLGRFDQSLAPLLLNGEYEACKRILLIAANSSDDIATCTALLWQLDALDEGIAYLEARVLAAENGPQNPTLPGGELSREQRLLVSLLHARGDTSSAVALLRDEDGMETEIRNLLIAAADWPQASDYEAERFQNAEGGIALFPEGGIEQLTFAGAIHHYAQRDDRASQVIEQILKIAAQDESQRLYAAECLFAVDRYEEGIDLMRLRGESDAFRILCAQHRYREAFAVYEMDLSPESIDAWFALMLDPDSLKSQEGLLRLYEGIGVAGQLAMLGERDQAAKYYQEIADLLLADADNPNHTLLREVCRQEFLLGFDEQAWSQMADLFKTRRFVTSDPLRGDFGRRTLFSTNTVIAGFWWRVLAESYPDSIDRLKALQELMNQRVTNNMPEPDTQRMLEKAVARISQTPELHRYREHIMFADFCFDIGMEQMANDNYRAAFELGDANSAVKLGDMAREEGQYEQAADWYAQAFQRNPTLVSALYLQSICLRELGKEKEADETKLKALLVSLPAARANSLADALLRRSFTEDAIEVWRRVTATSEPLSPFYSDAYGRLGNLWSESEPRQAANAWRQVYAGVMKQERNFVSFDGYLNMSELIHHATAIALLAEENVTEALPHIELCRLAEPGNTKVGEDFVPRLEALGRQEEADKLFEALSNQHELALQQFPKSALHHNNLAWLSARCNRQIDRAFELAQRAVELEPDSSNYLDTLAEVSYLRGDISFAIELARKCIAIEPAKEHYHEQLVRFQKALENQ